MFQRATKPFSSDVLEALGKVLGSLWATPQNTKYQHEASTLSSCAPPSIAKIVRRPGCVAFVHNHQPPANSAQFSSGGDFSIFFFAFTFTIIFKFNFIFFHIPPIPIALFCSVVFSCPCLSTAPTTYVNSPPSRHTLKPTSNLDIHSLSLSGEIHRTERNIVDTTQGSTFSFYSACHFPLLLAFLFTTSDGHNRSTVTLPVLSFSVCDQSNPSRPASQLRSPRQRSASLKEVLLATLTTRT